MWLEPQPEPEPEPEASQSRSQFPSLGLGGPAWVWVCSRVPPTEPSTESLSSTFLTFTPSTKPPCVFRQGSLTLPALLRAHLVFSSSTPRKGATRSVACPAVQPWLLSFLSPRPIISQPSSWSASLRSAEVRFLQRHWKLGPSNFPFASRRSPAAAPILSQASLPASLASSRRVPRRLTRDTIATLPSLHRSTHERCHLLHQESEL